MASTQNLTRHVASEAPARSEFSDATKDGTGPVPAVVPAWR